MRAYWTKEDPSSERAWLERKIVMFFFQDLSAGILAASGMGSKILHLQAFCQSLAHEESFDIG